MTDVDMNSVKNKSRISENKSYLTSIYVATM